MFTGATEGRIDGPPAAMTLAASTFIYFIGTSLSTDMNGGSNTLFAAVNLIFSLLLLASVKRVAVRADFKVEILTDRRPGLDHIAAAAGGGDLFIIRVNFGLHRLTAL